MNLNKVLLKSVSVLLGIAHDYIVWDKKAEIKFIKPGKKDVFAEFNISQQQVDEFKTQLESQEKLEPVFEVDIVDADGTLIAKVWKTLYLSKKR